MIFSEIISEYTNMLLLDMIGYYFLLQDSYAGYVSPKGVAWNCYSRLGISTGRKLVHIYEICILWFIPLVLLLFTYISVSLSLIRSIRQTSALSELKK